MATTTSLTSVFPMDSSATPTINDDGLPVYDRAYNASDLRRVVRTLFTDGVFTDYLDELNVSSDGVTWSVSSGAAIARGLLIDVEEAVEVISQTEIGSNQYAYIVVAGYFDKSERNAKVYAVVSSSSTYEPVRTDSIWELVLARIDQNGTCMDTRLDDEYCGACAPFEPVDTDSFMASLKTALSQFDFNIGTVTTLPPMTTPTIKVNKPETAGEPITIDFGIPRGATGAAGKDGVDTPTTWIRPEDNPPQAVYDAVWFVDDKNNHTITDIRCYETESIYPGESLYPTNTLYPGGNGQWVSHTLSPDLVANAS